MQQRPFLALGSALPFCFFSCLLILSSPCLALDPDRLVTQYAHSSWTSDQGLPQNSVNAMVQTADSYIWLGTLEGLVRFDGITFSVFDRRNTPQLPSNRISALFASSDGALWIGTANGLSRYENGRFADLTSLNRLLARMVLAIAERNRDEIWVGTDSGLAVWKKGQFNSYTMADGLADDPVTALSPGEAGSMWIGTRSGLNLYSNDRFIPVLESAGSLKTPVRTLRMDHEKRQLWIGTEHGLYSYENGRLASFSTADGLSSDQILSLLEDRAGNLWIGSANGGLNRLHNGQFSWLTRKEGLSSDFVGSLMEDREGNLWIGTWGGGLDQLRDSKFVNFTTREGLAYDSVSAFAETRDGSMWIGTFAGGLSRWRNGFFTTITTKQGLCDNVVCTLFEDSKGVLWIGTMKGLNRYENGRMHVIDIEDGSSNRVINSVLEDYNGDVWIANKDGRLDRYHNGILMRFTARDGLTNDNVYSMIRAQDHSIWIGCKDGLFRFENGRFTRFSTASGLSHNFVTALYEGSRGVLWIGTSGGGLNRYKNGKFTTITSKNGLFDDTIGSILEDDNEYLWLTSNRGILRIALKQLNDFCEGLRKDIVGTTYGKSDGMPTNECNSSQFASWKARDGKLWFATLKGATVVDPRQIRINQTPPAVWIQQMKVDDQSYGRQAIPALITPGKIKFEFQYTGLSFSNPARVQFKYKLEGMDAQWVQAGTRRAAYYSNLDHGHYRFRVIAANEDGIWNPAGDSITFDLKPFFYQTPWFYALCVAFAVSLAWTVHRVRLRHVRRRFLAILEERMRIARDLHDTLAQSLSGMVAQIDAADVQMDHDPQKVRGALERIRNLAVRGLEETRQAIWKLRPQSEPEGDLAKALLEISSRAANQSGVPVRVNVMGTPVIVAEAISENLIRIAQQAIDNAVQHSSPSSVEVLLSFKRNSLMLRVRDDGCGFDESMQQEDQQRFGLQGMKERAAQIKGEFNLVSKTNEGTQVSIQVQL